MKWCKGLRFCNVLYKYLSNFWMRPIITIEKVDYLNNDAVQEAPKTRI